MKKKLFDPLKVALSQKILQVLEGRWPEFVQSNTDNLLETINNLIVLPPQREMGHLAWGTFPLAKQLKIGPPQIAQEVAKLLKSSEGELFQQVQSAGPYVNFFFSGKVLTEKILLPTIQNDFQNQSLFEHVPKTMVEYSQPNTHKELHVGHMRNACLGDALVRLFKYSGVPVISTTFPGDVGTHVAKCLWYMKFHNQQPEPLTHKGEWLGQMYSKANEFLESRVGTPDEAKDREILTQILKQIESKSGEYFELWKKTREWSFQLMKEVYHWCGIHFDHWYWESDVDSDSVKTVKKYLDQGQLIISEGAVGMDLSDENLGFCVLLKSDGNGLYSTKDIELARRKFQDHHIEKSIYVVDMRQALHFKQVFASLKKLGFKEADQCFHLQYNFVELPDGAMSSRKGNIVPLTSLIQQMEKHVKENYLNRYVEEWSAQEINEISEIVSKGAIKYGMLRIDPNKKIVFDMTEWLKLDGESGPYIQYAYARIQSILRKFSDCDFSKALGTHLVHSTELQLGLLLGQLDHSIVQAVENYRPNIVCNYLYEVAKLFSQFYHDCSIGHAENEELKRDRLMLAKSTGLILKRGLGLLGIPVPDKM